MVRLMVSELEEEKELRQAVFAVAAMEIKKARNGEPFLFLRIGDRSGQVDARQFRVARLPQQFSVGDAIAIDGRYTQQYGVEIYNIGLWQGPIEPTDFLPSCPRDIDDMTAELKDLCSSVSNPYLKELLGYFEHSFWDDFILWPGAERIHHAYLGGLLEHTLAVARISDALAQSYSVDRDLLVAGSILHDLGKLEELQVSLTITKSKSGSLLGHTYQGAIMVQKSIEAIRAAATDFPEELERRLTHIILSHHGNLEWGAVVKPMTLEAFIVHVADLADSQANRFLQIIEDQRQRGVTLGPRDFFLETRVYSPPEYEAAELSDR